MASRMIVVFDFFLAFPFPFPSAAGRWKGQ